MTEKVTDGADDKTPRGAVRFLVESASAIVPTLKNPGRRRGAAEEIRKAKVQLDAELSRLYAIERTARHLFDGKGGRDAAEEVDARKSVEEALAVQVPE